MSELRDECGVAAIYHLPHRGNSPLCAELGSGDRPPEERISEIVSRFMPRMLLDIQNRGQLAAGMTTFSPGRNDLLQTHKDIGNVAEVFRMSHRTEYGALMEKYDGRAAIGHVRYATCGADDRNYAQPFERQHIKKHKWFSFAFNGQLSNYADLRKELLDDDNNHLARETDTEVLMHAISQAISDDRQPDWAHVLRQLSAKFDGAYSLVILNALGEMLVVRDPLGIKPLCYAIEGPLFAAASESVALMNLGFTPESIKPVPPGQAIVVRESGLEFITFAASERHAHCFFEWVYFANVASTLDNRSVYLARKALGAELARLELAGLKAGRPGCAKIDEDTVVVPVPDTSKAAADAMAFALGVPSVEGLIRNRYAGRTFIEGRGDRKRKAETKYTPLREVLEGKRVILVEDSIVRATTLQVLLRKVRQIGLPREIHVRVACPPIISPCFYGIDMSTISELFAPQFMHDGPLTPEIEARMALRLGADSLRYLPVDAVARAIGLSSNQLCQACITGQYPTPCGQKLAQLAITNDREHIAGRTYEAVGSAKQLFLRQSR
jgi:amidophosphoribosyltransferase